MWVKLTANSTGWAQSVGNTADTYYALDKIPYLEVRGPAGEAALDELVKSAPAGGVARP